MDIKSLRSLLDEVTRQVTDRRILLFGSSSLLASYPEEAPDRIGVETTIDADFFLDPDDKAFRAVLLAELGKEQSYHIANGYYGDFVDLRMAEGFPQGWRERLVPTLRAQPDPATTHAIAHQRKGRPQQGRPFNQTNLRPATQRIDSIAR